MARIPDIRFRGFVDDWRGSQINKEIDYSSTGISASDAVSDGKYQLYDANEVIGRVNHYASASSYISIIKDGSGVGRVRLLPGLTNCIGTMGVITPKGDNNVNFILSHFLTKSFKQHIIAGAIPHVYFKDYGEDDMILPSAAEQLRIGEYFGALDELIENTQGKLDRMRNLKTAMLEQMFPCAGSDVPRIRFKGYSGPWERKSLRELLNCSMDYGMNAAATTYDGTHKYLRITDIDENSRQFNRSDMTSPNVLSFDSNYELKEGDIVFARTGASVGKTYIYDKKDGLVYFAGFLIRARVNLEKYCPYFVFTSTQIEDYMRYIKITSQRTGQPGVNAQEYESFSLLVPSLDEQRMIGDFFAELDGDINATASQITKLKKTKLALLDKMLLA